MTVPSGDSVTPRQAVPRRAIESPDELFVDPDAATDSDATEANAVGLSVGRRSAVAPEATESNVARLAFSETKVAPETEVAPLANPISVLAEPMASSAPKRAENSTPDLSTYERLRLGPPTDRLIGWLVTIIITAIAAMIRFVNLGYPNKLVFDETYYAKDAYALWHFGYEREWPSEANDSIVAGTPDVYGEAGSFIVHPPVGKWLIGFGEHLFGMNGFGWRFMPWVFGVLLVFIVIRLARRLSRSTLVGGIAGVLLTFDGLAFVLSRTALLDIFQAFFLVAAVACCVADRDYYRAKLADRLEASGIIDLQGAFGPIVLWRPWRLLAGIMFGLALGTKWNSVFLIAVMGIISVVWDVGARRLAGAGWHAWLGLLIDGVPAFIRLVVISAAIYVTTWASWFLTDGGYDRNWGASNPDSPLTQNLGDAVASFVRYHIDIFNFHTGDYISDKTHPYDAHPVGWLIMLRPIGIDAVNDIQPGVDGCPAAEGDTCVQVISGMGTPVLWWLAVIALVVSAIWWFGARDWRFGLPIAAMLATYIPWFFTTDRPQFFFYAITIVPFTVIALAMVLGLFLGPKSGPHRRRNGIIVGVLVALVLANFAWIYPVLTDGMLTHGEWLARMWLRTWI